MEVVVREWIFIRSAKKRERQLTGKTKPWRKAETNPSDLQNGGHRGKNRSISKTDGPKNGNEERLCTVVRGGPAPKRRNINTG